MAGTQGYSDSYPDEKTHADASAYEHAGSGAPHLVGTQGYSDSYPDEKTHADASSNKYANFNQHTNTDIYCSPDISAAAKPHTNSDKVAYADTHTYEYAPSGEAVTQHF